MANKKESFFWTSYSDLMTSLFFIMLVLFILVIVLLHKRMETTEKELEDIKKVEASTQDLNRDYFQYRPEYEKFILKVNCFFPVRQHDINLLSYDTAKKLEAAGIEIKKFLADHGDYKYLVIIEGQASKDSENWTDFNYELSFRRAYSLMKYWQDVCKIKFGENCEIQISGSGDGTYNKNTMRDTPEAVNQRFLIYIIPKNIIENEKR